MTCLKHPKFCRIEEVAEDLGVSTKTIRRWIEQGRFPKPLRIGLRTHVWLRSEWPTKLEQLVREREAQDA